MSDPIRDDDFVAVPRSTLAAAAGALVAHASGKAEKTLELLRAVYFNPAIATQAPSEPLDAEALIAACLPGGSICDPQAVADAIRAYCGAPSEGADAQSRAALWAIIKAAEASKEPCGMDAESPAAIRNGAFAGIAGLAAQGLGLVRGPALAQAPREEEAGRPSVTELTALLPGPYYMDPPDGGSVELLEQLQRMARDAVRYRWLRSTTNFATSGDRRIDVRNMPEVWDAAIDECIARAIAAATDAPAEQRGEG